MESGKDQVTKTDVGYEIPTWNNWTPLAKFYHPLQAGSIDGTDTAPHDKAVSRAMVSKYKPNKRISGEPHKTLFVGKLSKETTEETVYKAFSKYGEVVKCMLVRDVVTGFSRGYAFVEYRNQRETTTAWREMHKGNIDGNTVLVEYEAARTLKGWIPRRLGGGFGGKKESGQLRFGGRDRPFRRPIPIHESGNQQTPFRGSRGHEDCRSERENYRDSERSRNKDSSKHSENHRESHAYRDRERDREKSRESSGHRERDRDSWRSGHTYRERDLNSEGFRYRERECERSRDGDRDRGGERYRNRGRYGDNDGSRFKDSHSYRDRRCETYDSHVKRKEITHGLELEDGKRT